MTVSVDNWQNYRELRDVINNPAINLDIERSAKSGGTVILPVVICAENYQMRAIQAVIDSTDGFMPVGRAGAMPPGYAADTRAKSPRHRLATPGVHSLNRHDLRMDENSRTSSKRVRRAEVGWCG